VKVKYEIEETRVGQKTNYDKLTIEIWTNGTIDPHLALVDAAKILRKHLNPFVQYDAIGNEVVPHEISQENDKDLELFKKLAMSLTDLSIAGLFGCRIPARRIQWQFQCTPPARNSHYHSNHRDCMDRDDAHLIWLRF
jgi:hypothetical protein